MKHIVLTGGGTAGHVTPNIALIPKLKEAGYALAAGADGRFAVRQPPVGRKKAL